MNNCFDLICFGLFVRVCCGFFLFFFCLNKFVTFYLVIFDETFLGHCHPSPKYGDAKEHRSNLSSSNFLRYVAKCLLKYPKVENTLNKRL